MAEPVTYYEPAELFTLSDYMRALKLGESTARKLIAKDESAARIGGSWRIPGWRLNEICRIVPPKPKPKRGASLRAREDGVMDAMERMK